MASYHSGAFWQRLTDRELSWCLRFNRATRQQSLERLFAMVSRLGDGGFWYGLMGLLLMCQGLTALPALARMLVVGVVGLTLYRWLKASINRLRPCDCEQEIRVTVPPLDRYSFPSGHTLHAVAFSMVTVFHYPGLAWVVLPFTLLVALSRLVLGLHYPSDVLAGGLLGGALAFLVLRF
jgi:undecaprenyl-diphosphatase